MSSRLFLTSYHYYFSNSYLLFGLSLDTQIFDLSSNNSFSSFLFGSRTISDIDGNGNDGNSE